MSGLDLPDVEMFGVYNRGVANQEHIILRVNRAVSLSQYGLLIGVGSPAFPNETWPLADHYLWLGSYSLGTPGWVFVYTGIGKAHTSQESNTKQPIQVLFWNRKKTIFNDASLRPALIHLDYFEATVSNQSLQPHHYRNEQLPNPFLQALASSGQDDSGASYFAKVLEDLAKKKN